MTNLYLGLYCKNRKTLFVPEGKEKALYLQTYHLQREDLERGFPTENPRIASMERDIREKAVYRAFRDVRRRGKSLSEREIQIQARPLVEKYELRMLERALSQEGMFFGIDLDWLGPQK